MNHLIAALLVVVGIIHLLPLSGVLGAERLAALYGLDFKDPSLLILMRHRAVLFGLLGIFLVLAAFKPSWQSAAIAGGLVSVTSFIALAYLSPGYNAALHRVVIADWVALACLVAAVLLGLWARRSHS